MKTGCLVCGKVWDFTGKNGSCPGADHPGVCPSCLADARLGRLVRNVPEGSELIRARVPEIAAFDFSKWAVEILSECGDESDRHSLGATPEEALERAGVREVGR